MENVLEFIETGKRDVKEMESESLTLKEDTKDFKIDSPAKFAKSGEFVKMCKDNWRQLETKRTTITAPLNTALNEVNAYFKGIQSRFLDAGKIVTDERIKYQLAEDERIAKEQARLNELARQEEEKKRLQLETRAEKALEKGQEEKAQELQQLAQSVFVPAMMAAPAIQKTAGISLRGTWKWRIKDIKIVPREYFILDEKLLNKIAKASSGVGAPAGIEFYEEMGEAVRL